MVTSFPACAAHRFEVGTCVFIFALTSSCQHSSVQSRGVDTVHSKQYKQWLSEEQ